MKVTINGEVFEFDPARKPMSEALAIEDGLKIPYAQYEEGLREGRARSVAGLIWLMWRRNGRDVPLAGILDGSVDIDLSTVDIEPDGETPDPTPSPAGKGASDTTGASTSASSRKSSA